MPKSRRMTSRRSKKGGLFGLDEGESNSSTGSWWDKLTGKKTGYGAPGYGAPGYGAPGYGAPGYGSTSMNQPYGSTSMNQPYGSTSMNQPYGSTSMNPYGGKRRRMRGGSVTPNMSLTNLAASAQPISGAQTVQAQTWVGGRTRRRRHRHTKSCKKSCKKR